MLTLFGDLESGNVHKAQMILRRVGLPYRRVDAAQSRGEPRSREFLAINPIGKVPTVLFDDGDVLSESGAILYFFGNSTDLWPADLRAQGEVLRWMFFEQYSHEPSLAVMRYVKHFAAETIDHESRMKELEPKARRALEIMAQRLALSDWIAGPACSLADFALYPYTKVMEDSGFHSADYPSIRLWLTRIEQEQDFIVMGRDGSEETITFQEYMANRKGNLPHMLWNG